jgi:hypothetical protein
MKKRLQKNPVFLLLLPVFFVLPGQVENYSSGSPIVYCCWGSTLAGWIYPY